MTPAVFHTDLNLSAPKRGKVRDLYDLPPDRAGNPRLLIVATDRLSAFDVVLPTPIPGKGCVLTTIAAWWLRWIEHRGLCRTHLLSTDPGDLPNEAFQGATTTRSDLAGRITIGRRCRVVPVEFVVRGYLEGSGWAEYQKTGRVCGIELPAGLQRCSQLPEPIFTPATKAEQGAHDENIDFERACSIVGGDLMRTLRDRSLAIYCAAAAQARDRGILIADTKFEFGLPQDAKGEPTGEEAILIDEALTPDSSRFWPADQHTPGSPQPSFDKQFVREYLGDLIERGLWDKTDPGPELPERIVRGTLERYERVCQLLCGEHATT